MEHFGRYELIRPLGVGGMAEVFLARMPEEGDKLFAIKRLRPHLCADEHVIQRLVAEARLTVWLSHENIVQIFDFGRVDNVYYIAMEYVDGCDLRRLIKHLNQQQKRLPLTVALSLVNCLLAALDYAHQCTNAEGKMLGIIHRDVSPHNILLSREGHVQLADFGIARVTLFSLGLTQPGTLIGKVGYMAPEQAKSLSYDARVDIFATGAVLYEMLTGQKPFTARRSALEAGRYEIPDPPSHRRPSISPALDDLVLKAMAPRPEQRWPSAREMLRATQNEIAEIGQEPATEILQGLLRTVNNSPPPSESLPIKKLTLKDYNLSSDSLISEVVTARGLARQSSLLVDTPAEKTDSLAVPPPAIAPPAVAPAAVAPPVVTTALLAVPAIVPLSAMPTQLKQLEAVHDYPTPVDADLVLPSSMPAEAEKKTVPSASPPFLADVEIPTSIPHTSAGLSTTLATVPTQLKAPPPLATKRKQALQTPRLVLILLPLAVLIIGFIVASQWLMPPRRTRAPSSSTPVRHIVHQDATTTNGSSSFIQVPLPLTEDDSTGPQPAPPEQSREIPARTKPPSSRRKDQRIRPPTESHTLLPEATAQLKHYSSAAKQAFTKGHFLSALRLAQQMLYLDPRQNEAWILIGTIGCMLHEQSQAQEAYRNLNGPSRRQLRQFCHRHGHTIK